MAQFNLNEILSNTVESADGCLEWQGAKSKAGYGQKGKDYKVFYTHRIVAQLVHGLPKANEEVLHSCDNRACCNPNHLSWGSRKENVQDMFRKGRNRPSGISGEKHHQAKLKESQVIEIRKRRLQGEKLIELAKDFGVTISNIHLITSGKKWKETQIG